MFVLIQLLIQNKSQKATLRKKKNTKMKIEKYSISLAFLFDFEIFV